jgi:protein-S-isoprenylcysteine O-methyltransferase Ste14
MRSYPSRFSLRVAVLWGLVPAVALCVAVVIRLLDEERILSLELPGYEGYRRQVRSRLIPLLW